FKGLGGVAAAKTAGDAAAAGAGGKLVSSALGGGSFLGGLLSAGVELLAGWPLYEKFKEVGWQGIFDAMFPKEKMPGVPTGVVDSYKETFSHTDAERKQALDYGLGLLLGKGEEKKGEEPEPQPTPSGGLKRKKNITGTADESSMTGYMPEPEPNGPTQAQKEAAEAFWDVFRERFEETPDSAFDDLEKAFEGDQELYEKLDSLIDQLSEYDSVDSSWRDMEDLPANWWLDAANWQLSGNQNNGNAITSGDLQNFRNLPAAMAAAARSGTADGVSNIRVVIDGYTAGRLLAPYVSEFIAQDYTG
ncbi:MAG: hypothetical protein IKN04_07235, partial [Clostridia bacterium]|nr:hypothetical protein [Clostridia bacterium]